MSLLWVRIRRTFQDVKLCIKSDEIITNFDCFFSLKNYQGGLDRDNPTHRGWSNDLDARYKDSEFYNRLARPVIHGAYHANRYAFNGHNPEEQARAKDQFNHARHYFLGKYHEGVSKYTTNEDVKRNELQQSRDHLEKSASGRSEYLEAYRQQQNQKK